MATEYKRIKLLRDTSSNWNSNDPVLLSGEQAYATDTGTMKIGNGTDNYSDIEFFQGYDKIISSSLAVSGWYTIAEMDSVALGGGSCLIVLGCRGSARLGNMIIRCSFIQSSSAKTLKNASIEIKGRATNGTTFDTVSMPLKRVRLAKSDSVNDSGAKIQVYIDVSTTVNLITELYENTGTQYSDDGWGLKSAYLDNTPTLPDGVTTGTFLEAGSEIYFDTGTTYYPSNWVARVNDANTLICSISTAFRLRYGTTATLTLPSTSLIFRNADVTATGTVSAAATISGEVFNEYDLKFTLTEPGVFSALTTGQIVFPQISGSGCKIVIS